MTFGGNNFNDFPDNRMIMRLYLMSQIRHT